MRLIFTVLIAFCLSLFAYHPAFAIVDPLASPNNRFGIHILNEDDIPGAANLVNSKGDWGYVTLVIQDNDRNPVKWQAIFNSLREKHLIPIVRIATHGQGETWVKPVPGEAAAWVSFLDSLVWVTKNKYVVIFNEPNHASEWGNRVSPSEYSEVFSAYAKALKSKSEDFFILNAGFDASATNGQDTVDEDDFLSGMVAHNPTVFENLDGWVSHSYPNPGFSSSPKKEGRGSIKTFIWETEHLKNLGINRPLPIFITETGWSLSFLSEKKISDYYKEAFENVWNDPQIVAITPFVLNYQGRPFNTLSWKKHDGNFNSWYQTIADLDKTVGNPVLIPTPTPTPDLTKAVSEHVGEVLAINDTKPQKPKFQLIFDFLLNLTSRLQHDIL